jgi:hypothetical protein
MQHRHGAIELRLSLGAARDWEADFAEFFLRHRSAAMEYRD